MTRFRSESGFILMFSVAILFVLISASTAYLLSTAVISKSGGLSGMDEEALWLAEAGLNKAIWNLRTPPAGGGQGEGWITTGTTESLGEGTYTMVVSRYDFALSANGSIATDNPTQTNPLYLPVKAIDGDDGTGWLSQGVPHQNSPQDLIIAFPYPLNINKVRFVSNYSPATRPKDYALYVSTNNSFTDPPILTITGNDCLIREHEFTTKTGMSFLKLQVTKAGVASQRVVVLTLEVLGKKVTSTGTTAELSPGNSVRRKVSQTMVVSDNVASLEACANSIGTQRAHVQEDWAELAP